MAIKTAQKTALITGCSEGGIGFALAKEFQSRSVHVFATARSVGKMAALESLPNVTLLALDVTSQSSIDAAVTTVSERTGGTLDYLVNNSGIQYINPLVDFDMALAKEMYDVNVFGLFAVTKSFVPLVVKAKGSIANLASIAGARVSSLHGFVLCSVITTSPRLLTRFSFFLFCSAIRRLQVRSRDAERVAASRA
jgi:NADP-dependent 3-hydroxy acid dehydrogenase YdfG